MLDDLVGASPAQWLERLEGMDPEDEIHPGITVALWTEWLRPMRTPPPAPPGSHWRPDVVYGTAGAGGRNLVLHLYAGDRGARRAGIVLLHGGGWTRGHPHFLVRLAGDLAAEGYVTATVSYRLSGEARWPAALEDAKCAVRWMRAHSLEIGLDPERIAVAGTSAGGHLAAMVALTPGRYEGTGGWADVPSDVQAAVLYNPATDLRALADDSTRALLGDGGDEAAIAASPVTHVTPSCPPVLTRVGELDHLTTPASCQAFHRALDVAAVRNEIEIVPGVGHGLPYHDHAGCVRSTARFLAEHLGSRATT